MADDKKGMLRHVDALGRVVIPREVRKALRINYGDLLEFCACSNKQVVVRKFHIIREIVPQASQIVKIAKINNKCDIAIIDTEKVICWNGETAKDFGAVFDEVRALIEERKPQVVTKLELSSCVKLEGECAFRPILCDGDILGAVVVGGGKIDKAQEISQLIAEFFANYFSD